MYVCVCMYISLVLALLWHKPVPSLCSWLFPCHVDKWWLCKPSIIIKVPGIYLMMQFILFITFRFNKIQNKSILIIAIYILFFSCLNILMCMSDFDRSSNIMPLCYICPGTDLNDFYMDWFSATSNSILDRAIDSEDAQHKDFLRLVRKLPWSCMCIKIIESILGFWSHCCIILQEHVEGYHELSAKTKTFFTTAVAKWDADFYVKVDDDVHVNLGTNTVIEFFFILFEYLNICTKCIFLIIVVVQVC